MTGATGTPEGASAQRPDVYERFKMEQAEYERLKNDTRPVGKIHFNPRPFVRLMAMIGGVAMMYKLLSAHAAQRHCVKRLKKDNNDGPALVALGQHFFPWQKTFTLSWEPGAPQLTRMDLYKRALPYDPANSDIYRELAVELGRGARSFEEIAERTVDVQLSVDAPEKTVTRRWLLERAVAINPVDSTARMHLSLYDRLDQLKTTKKASA